MMFFQSLQIRRFPIFCFVFQGPHNSRKSFACLDNVSSSSFLLYQNIIALRTCFSFRWSGFWTSKPSQSLVNAHILHTILEELANAYPKSFFFILSCKVMNVVLNNIHTAPFINSLANSTGLYGNFGLSLKCYGIDLLIKLAKYFIIISPQTKTFQSTNLILARVHVLIKNYHMLSCPVKSNRVSKSIINVFFNSLIYLVWNKLLDLHQKKQPVLSQLIKKVFIASGYNVQFKLLFMKIFNTFS